MSIEHGTDLTTEFHRIADQPAPPYLVDLGQIVTTGSCTGLRFLKPGDRCTVRFENLGEAEVVFSD